MRIEDRLGDWIHPLSKSIDSLWTHGAAQIPLEWLDDALARFLFYYPLFMA